MTIEQLESRITELEELVSTQNHIVMGYIEKLQDNIQSIIANMSDVYGMINRLSSKILDLKNEA